MEKNEMERSFDLIHDSDKRCDIDNINVLIVLMLMVVVGNEEKFNYGIIRKYKSCGSVCLCDICFLIIIVFLEHCEMTETESLYT